MSKDVQETPQWFFDELDATYHFILDACADLANHKCLNWYGPDSLRADALEGDWPLGGWIWMNPPYSRGNQRRFVEKAIEQAKRGTHTIALLPADTSTRLFHELIYPDYDIEFLKKRLKFNNAKQGAKFGNMLVKISDHMSHN